MWIRPAQPADIEAIALIEAASPATAQWRPADYLLYDCRVAAEDGQVVGFIISRPIAGDREILNLAVDPRFRRRGIARRLVQDVLPPAPGACYLEVRESNLAARRLYQKCGFHESGKRPNYYESPLESAIVMTFFS
jgi:ribosomal-protein-alanine N-acetyltransferase